MKKLKMMVLPLLLIGMTGCASFQPVKIESHKECPLCGMLPARYPMFNCQILFKDGGHEAFDSAVGLLVYLHFPEKAGIEPRSAAKIYFKDYLKESWIEADKTFFVTGSEIMGPMGVEFLPVDGKPAAEELKKREKGKEIIHFGKIDRAYMIKAAEAGWLHYLAKKLVLE